MIFDPKNIKSILPVSSCDACYMSCYIYLIAMSLLSYISSDTCMFFIDLLYDMLCMTLDTCWILLGSSQNTYCISYDACLTHTNLSIMNVLALPDDAHHTLSICIKFNHVMLLMNAIFHTIRLMCEYIYDLY